MRRINTDDQRTTGDGEIEGEEGSGIDPVRWTNAMLMAHVETPAGPDLQIVREELVREMVLRVDAGANTASSSRAMIIVDSDEVILALESNASSDRGDASIMAGFEISRHLPVRATGVSGTRQVAVILRNFEAGMIHVLDERRQAVELEPGLWTIQAASVPDGRERTSVLEFGT